MRIALPAPTRPRWERRRPSGSFTPPVGTANRRAPELQPLGDPAAIAARLDPLLDLHDFREGARSGRLPSREDPALRDRLSALMHDRSRLHAAVVERDGRLVAGHIASLDGNVLTVVLAARSPIEPDSVSAEMYLRSLSRQLGDEAVAGVELAAGALDIAPEPQPSVAAPKRSARARVLEGRARLRRWLWHDEELRLYRRPTAEVDLAEPIEPLERNSVSDLLQYEDGSRDGMSRQAFLQMALERLEDGWTAYSISEDGLLLNSRWVVSRVGRLPLDPFHQIPLPGDAVYFADVFTDPRGRGRGLQVRGSRYCAQEAARRPGVNWIVAAVLGSNQRSIRNVERAGYHHAASTLTRRRLGMERTWQEPTVPSLPPAGR